VVNKVLYDGTVESQVTNCYSNSIKKWENYNKIKVNMNTFKNNSFGNYCYNNSFGNNCYDNSFGNNCYDNSFDDYLQNRHIDENKVSITLNDKYYDDGSGQVVPIKHPDLSTQASILPYKFMGQYVYEQLIPKSMFSYNGIIDNVNDVLAINTPILLKCDLLGGATCSAECAVDGVMLNINIQSVAQTWERTQFVRLVYTSMPEDSSYYGYNN
jgi:hypothetical protein